jgi:hypothetical protein
MIKENFYFRKGLQQENFPFELTIRHIEEDEGNMSSCSSEDAFHNPANKMIICIIDGLLFLLNNLLEDGTEQLLFKYGVDLVKYINISEYSSKF